MSALPSKANIHSEMYHATAGCMSDGVCAPDRIELVNQSTSEFISPEVAHRSLRQVLALILKKHTSAAGVSRASGETAAKIPITGMSARGAGCNATLAFCAAAISPTFTSREGQQ